MNGRCALCGREEDLTRHHLVPRMLIRRQRKIKDDDKKHKDKSTIKICAPCHSNIHTCFAEKQLADRFNSLAKLKKQEPIIKFTEWIKSKPAGFKPKKKARARKH